MTLAAFLGSAGVSESADLQNGLDAYKNEDYTTALCEWTSFAKLGNTEVQSNLDVMYDNGRGVPKDFKAAVKWYGLAVE